MNADEIRVAVSYHENEGKHSDTIRTLCDAALAFADSMDDPIWWCFKHNVKAETLIDERCGVGYYFKGFGIEDPCDIAKATRPRRIE